MKAVHLIMVLLALAPMVCQAQVQGGSPKSSSSDIVEAYYFHNTTRCATCRAVESEARQNIETLYPELVKQGKMSFQAFDLGEEQGKIMAKKLGVAGQSLLLVKGTNKVDITNEGFLYALTNPARLKSIMKEKIDGLMGL